MPTDLPTSQIHGDFQRDGVVVLPGFFTADDLAAARQAIQSYFQINDQFRPSGGDLDKAQCEVIAWGPVEEGEAAFVQLSQDTRLDAATHAALGGDYQPLQSLVMFSPPRSKGQSWHQDCVPDRPDRFNVNRLIYIDDVTEANGGQVVIVPGSHLRGELPPGGLQDDLPDQQVLTPTAGSLVLLHGMTYHRVMPIVGERPRISINLRVRPPGTPDDITDIAIYRNMRYRFSTQQVLEQRV